MSRYLLENDELILYEDKLSKEEDKKNLMITASVLLKLLMG